MALFETTFPPYVPFGSRTLSLQTPRLSGTDVAVFQAVYNLMVQTMNILTPIGPPIALDGVFGASSRQAALNIQSYFGLTALGSVGSNTFFAFGQGVGPNVTYGGPAFGSRTLTQGMSGGDVTVLQNRLNCFRYASILGHPANGVFDAATAAAVIAFKQDAIANGQTGLTPDSTVGPGTFDAFWLYTFLGGRGLFSGRNGFDVVFLQNVLTAFGFYGGPWNGFYDAATIAAVRAFQADAGITVDGVVGQQTCYQIGLRLDTPAPRPFDLAWPPPPPPPPPAVLPCCIALSPTGVILPIQPFARGASLHYVGTTPPLLRPGVWGLVATLLPPPSTFGNFNHYQAVLFETPIDGVAFVMDLSRTPDGAWAGQFIDVISATITTAFRVQVRLAGPAGIGPTVLFGTLADCNA